MRELGGMAGERARAKRGVASPILEQEIFEQLRAAIVEQRLPPGTKLGEEMLCEIFAVSRPRIRRILQRLGYDRLVELQPNRGAYVARPSVKEAREVFAARRLVEASLVRGLAGRLSPAQTGALRRLIERERAAAQARDRQLSIRLSGEFHLCLAEVSDNTTLSEFLRELVSRTSLIIALYERPGESCCSFDDHQQILDALAAGRTDEATAAMETHLLGIEGRLRLLEPNSGIVDLRRALGRAG
jgi:DNA-binding GntR family transcriptional regulator